MKLHPCMHPGCSGALSWTFCLLLWSYGGPDRPVLHLGELAWVIRPCHVRPSGQMNLLARCWRNPLDWSSKDLLLLIELRNWRAALIFWCQSLPQWEDIMELSIWLLSCWLKEIFFVFQHSVLIRERCDFAAIVERDKGTERNKSNSSRSFTSRQPPAAILSIWVSYINLSEAQPLQCNRPGQLCLLGSKTYSQSIFSYRGQNVFHLISGGCNGAIGAAGVDLWLDQRWERRLGVPSLSVDEIVQAALMKKSLV